MQTVGNTAWKAPVSFERVYNGAPGEVRQVRADLAAAVEKYPDADDMIMVTSELAANAVMHSKSGESGGTFTVRAEVHDAYAWIEVEDQGGDWAPRDRQDDEHGRGLDVVAALAEDWGTENGDTCLSRVVWARINRDQPAMSQRLTDATLSEWDTGTLVQKTAAQLARDLRGVPKWFPVESKRGLAIRLNVSDTTACEAKRLLASHGVIVKQGAMYYIA